MIIVFNNVPMGSGMTMYNSWLGFKYRKEFGVIDRHPKYDSMYRLDWDKFKKENKKKAQVG